MRFAVVFAALWPAPTTVDSPFGTKEKRLRQDRRRFEMDREAEASRQIT